MKRQNAELLNTDGCILSYHNLHSKTLGDLTTTSKAQQDINIFYHVKPQWEKTIQHHIKTQANKRTAQQTGMCSFTWEYCIFLNPLHSFQYSVI